MLTLRSLDKLGMTEFLLGMTEFLLGMTESFPLFLIEQIVSVGDFHGTHLIDGHEYEILLIDDQGTVDSWTITSEEAAKTQYYTYTAEETAEFYRVEIFDKTTGVRIVIGNPIWND